MINYDSFSLTTMNVVKLVFENLSEAFKILFELF